MRHSFRSLSATVAAAISVLVIPVVAFSSTAYAASYPFGLYQGTNNLQYTFSKTPNYAIEYLGWSTSGTQAFPATNVQAAHNAGTQAFLEMQTCGNPCDSSHAFSLDNVINGTYDASLTTFANAINAKGYSVIMTFDHEMNGSWYPWDATDGGVSTGVTPAKYIAAWNHVTSLISGITTKVTWVWAPNIEQGGSALSQYWPGTGHQVGWCGLDGYYANTGTTWANRFASSVTDLKSTCGSLTWAVTETGIPATDSNAVSQTDDLINGAKTAGAKTLMYFDKSTWLMTSSMESEFVTDLG